MRIQNSANISSLSPIVSVTAESKAKKVSLKNLARKFNPKSIYIILIFMIFERQALKEDFEESKYASELISLLSVDVVDIIVKEPLEKKDEYQHIKSVLLKRFN